MGPRPALPNEVATYNDYQRQRLLVKPGMTAIGKPVATATRSPSTSGSILICGGLMRSRLAVGLRAASLFLE